MRHDGVVTQPIEVACTLTAGEIPDRVAAWKNVVAGVASRDPIADGFRLVLADDAPIGEIVELARAEQKCCAFFSFALTIDSRGVALEITAPEEAAGLIEELFVSSWPPV